MKELVGESEYVGVSYDWRGEAGDQQDCIVVSEGDLVAGEDIHTAAEEVTAWALKSLSSYINIPTMCITIILLIRELNIFCCLPSVQIYSSKISTFINKELIWFYLFCRINKTNLVLKC